VIQSWYLLWALPLIAATGLKRVWHLRAIVLGIGFFVVYALAEINVVSDSAIDLTDILSIAASIAVVVTVLVASPRERELITGEHLGRGLQPETDADFQILSQLRLSIGSAQR
jgi:hypothetical protein